MNFRRHLAAACCLSALLLPACISSDAGAPARVDEPSAAPALFHPPFDVEFDSDSSIFPESWRSPTNRAAATPLDPALRGPTIDRLSTAAAKYPSWIFRRYLRAVYVEETLIARGISAGGSNSRDCLYLTLPRGEAADLLQFERLFHAEFSSILFRELDRRFPRAEWEACNQGFTYGGNGVEAIRRGADSRSYSPWMASNGVLTQYSMSSLENDFNQIAAGLFMGQPFFWKWTDAYPRLKAKVELAIGFYQSIDPMFTESYFRTMPAQADQAFVTLTR